MTVPKIKFQKSLDPSGLYTYLFKKKKKSKTFMFGKTVCIMATIWRITIFTSILKVFRSLIVKTKTKTKTHLI